MSALPAHHFSGAEPRFTLTDRLRKSREYSRYNQHQLAAAMGVSRNTVSNAERGSHQVSRPVIIAWAYATGVSLEWLTAEGQEVVKCAPRDSNPEPSGSAANGAFAHISAQIAVRAHRVTDGAAA